MNQRQIAMIDSKRSSVDKLKRSHTFTSTQLVLIKTTNRVTQQFLAGVLHRTEGPGSGQTAFASHALSQTEASEFSIHCGLFFDILRRRKFYGSVIKRNGWSKSRVCDNHENKDQQCRRSALSSMPCPACMKLVVFVMVFVSFP